ncbi:MAG: hypothetical protein D3923_12200 [Candidatus Electrothrix sp. AR3]|nr:hypothetical protein [Candidatus Electrothrix sp. AR3]
MGIAEDVKKMWCGLNRQRQIIPLGVMAPRGRGAYYKGSLPGMLARANTGVRPYGVRHKG